MKFVYEIELRGDDEYQRLKLFSGICDENLGNGAGLAIVGKWPRPWVAKIDSACSKYGFNRVFLPYKKDYSRSNSKGSRGVYALFFLDDGCIYEVSCRGCRWFGVAKDGKLIKISKQEVIVCVKRD